ncbi:MAG: MGMT family protein [Dehalococcoidia bacterium]|nr:MAG: MGMT family protein [Dehalococcoidia bacterium]
MAYKRTSWREKLEDSKKFPKILQFDPKFPCGRALQKMGARPGDSVVLPPPLEVDEIMRNVPRGKLITLNEICRQLAARHNTDYCCTLTTGIFVMTAANAAEQARSEGEKNTTPYWRTLKMNGELNEKFPGGAEAQRELLEQEGHVPVRRGRKYVILDYESYLVE